MTKENPNRNAPFKIEVKRGVLAIEGTSDEFKTVSEDFHRIILECQQFLKSKMPIRVIAKDFSSYYREVGTTDGSQFTFSGSLGVEIDTALIALLGPEPEPEKIEDITAETLSQSQNIPLPLKAKKKHG
jgi:hypothetical protein